MGLKQVFIKTKSIVIDDLPNKRIWTAWWQNCGCSLQWRKCCYAGAWFCHSGNYRQEVYDTFKHGRNYCERGDRPEQSTAEAKTCKNFWQVNLLWNALCRMVWPCIFLFRSKNYQTNLISKVLIRHVLVMLNCKKKNLNLIRFATIIFLFRIALKLFGETMPQSF